MISFSLKGSRLVEEVEDNEMFRFWFHTHYQFTRLVFSHELSVEYLVRYINKEVLKTLAYSWVKVELQVEAYFLLRMQQRTPKQLVQFDRRFEEYMRPIYKLSNTKHNFSPSKRHSSLPKILWLHTLPLPAIDPSKQ